MTHNTYKLPLATALLRGLKGYNRETFRHDLTAGFVVSLLALPLSMALSIAVGLPPQHGLYTAIVAGIAAALLGGSSVQVSGPTAAFVVIVAPIVSDLGLQGIIWCQILAGLMLAATGFFRLGKLIHLVPFPVTTGFTAGIAVTIATLALNDFLGLGIEKMSGHYIDKAAIILSHLPQLKWQETAVGLISLLTIIYFPKVSKKVPATIVGIAAGTAVSVLLNHLGTPVDTLLSRFSFDIPGGGTGHGIPPYPPVFHFPDMPEFTKLLMPSGIIAALAALESLLSATVADQMIHARHDPDAELCGIGIANILSGLVAGIPATGAIARTAANVHAGAKTPVSTVIHALFILIYMLTLSTLISRVPMAALASLLLVTAWRMSHHHQFLEILKMESRGDKAVLLVCFTLTVLIDMVAGVTAGLLLAGMLYVRRPRKEKHYIAEEEEN